MHFSYPIFLYVLILVPLAVIFFIYTERKKALDLVKLAVRSAFDRLSANINPRKRIFRIILLVLALFFFILAASGPEIGGKLVEVKRSGIDLIIAVDCSSSMDTADIQPSRMVKAKDSLSAIINKMQGDRVGIVAFAGVAFVQCPLTLDYSAAKMLLELIDTRLIPKPGTAIGEAIRTGIKSFTEKERKHKAMILLTDGEDHNSDPLGAAKEARKEGVRIYTVGIGRPEGEPIPVMDASGKFTGYRKDKSGQTVMSKLDELLLQKIALETDGKYFRATGSDIELDRIYNDISGMEKKELKSTTYVKYENRYQYFAFIAFLLLIAEMLISERKKIWVPWKK
ncbi:MAG: VWA domain-containing protein [Candidatus Firestonebacteria bacterium]